VPTKIKILAKSLGDFFFFYAGVLNLRSFDLSLPLGLPLYSLAFSSVYHNMCMSDYYWPEESFLSLSLAITRNTLPSILEQ
jgi:hypothetical protein